MEVSSQPRIRSDPLQMTCSTWKISLVVVVVVVVVLVAVVAV